MQKIQRNHYSLSYHVAGQGNQHFVLIHNAGGNHQFMQNQFEFCAQFGKVLSVDLLGHGESDKPTLPYTPSQFAEDIAYILQENNIHSAAVIGLNFGANVAIELAAQTNFVSHLVLIDPPILLQPWVVTLIQDHIDELKNPQTENFAQNLVDMVFQNTTTENKLLAVAAFETTPKHVKISTYENLLAWDKSAVEKLQRCKMPILHIQSSTPFCEEIALKQYCPHIVTAKVVGSGVWATLEVPDQVNAMIKRFLIG